MAVKNLMVTCNTYQIPIQSLHGDLSSVPAILGLVKIKKTHYK